MHERWKGRFWNFVLASEFQLSKTTQCRNKWPQLLILLDIITLPCLLMMVSSLTHIEEIHSRAISPARHMHIHLCLWLHFTIASFQEPPWEIRVVLCVLPSQWSWPPQSQITTRNCKGHLVHISWFRMKNLRVTLYSTCYIFFCMILETFNFKYGDHYFIIIRKEHLIASMHDKSGNKHT